MIDGPFQTLLAEGWVRWAIVIIVGLPIALVLLSELHLRLSRRRHPLAKPVNQLRIWLLPAVGLLVLLTYTSNVSSDNTGVRIVATVVGVLAVSIALSAFNALFFDSAPDGSWRQRLPGIFSQLFRLILVVAGAAIVASSVWGFNVSGLWATLGVSGIVIGLALQNAVGSVVSGLLLLFEQPFQMGDRIDVAGSTGKVVEMNWRATHLHIGSGVQVIPNANLAAASFTNLNRPTPEHDHTVDLAFSAGDPPHRVATTVQNAVVGIGGLRDGEGPTIRPTGGGKYSVTLPLRSAGETSRAEADLRRWLWYAAKRDDLTLDDVAPTPAPPEQVREALMLVASSLEMSEDEVDEAVSSCRLVMYGEGEQLARPGGPVACGFVINGHVDIAETVVNDALIPSGRLDRGDIVSVAHVLHEPVTRTAVAATLVEVLILPRAMFDRLVSSKPSLGRRLNGLLDERDGVRAQVVAASGAPDLGGSFTRG